MRSRRWKIGRREFTWPPAYQQDRRLRLADAPGIADERPRFYPSGGYRRYRPNFTVGRGRSWPRFDDFLNVVYDSAMLIVAFDRVAGNTGSRTTDVDAMTVTAVEEQIGATVAA